MPWFDVMALLASELVFGKIPGVLLRQEEARSYLCQRMTADDAAAAYPGRFRADRASGEVAQRTAMVCAQRVLRLGSRDPRDEAVLTTLDARVSEVASAAWGVNDGLHDRTWLVEVFYPDGAVASKIGFATKTALMAQGASVSDRSVSLSASDVDVLTRMSPFEAYAAGCRRYAEGGALGAGAVLLAVVVVDPLDTNLHAGLCDGGRWSWLR